MRKNFISGLIQFIILLFVIVVGLVIIGFLVIKTDQPTQTYTSPNFSDENDNLDESQLKQLLDNNENNEIVKNNDDKSLETNDKVETLEPEINQDALPAEELNEDQNKPIDPIKDDKKINIDNLF